MLDWDGVSRFLDDTEWSHKLPFELQYLEFDDRVYASRVGYLAWQAFVHGLPESGSPVSGDAVRQGWHYTRDSTRQWAVLTATGSSRYEGPYVHPAWITPDPTPSILYGVAIDWRVIEDAILSRAYSRPATCHDAVVTILQAWEATNRAWTPTVLTIGGISCVIL